MNKKGLLLQFLQKQTKGIAWFIGWNDYIHCHFNIHLPGGSLYH